jgi:hypothetical protein
VDNIQFGGGADDNGDSASLETDTSQLYHGFLNDIPEQDREIVARYAKNWDGNVTKQFQKIHEGYKPYKELGDLQRLQIANEFFNRFETNPLEVYQIFKQGLAEQYGEDFENEMYTQDEDDQEFEEDDDEEYDDDEYEEVDLPDSVVEFLEGIGASVQDLVDWKSSQESQAQEAYENEQLDNMLTEMHNTLLKGYKLDEDDDDWLLIQMSKGREPAEAAQAWVNKFGGQQSASRPVARILSGQGGVPNDQVDLSKLRGTDRRSAVAALLEQANRE